SVLHVLSPEQQLELRNQLDQVLSCVASLRAEVAELRSGLQDIAQQMIPDVNPRVRRRRHVVHRERTDSTGSSSVYFTASQSAFEDTSEGGYTTAYTESDYTDRDSEKDDGEPEPEEDSEEDEKSCATVLTLRQEDSQEEEDDEREMAEEEVEEAERSLLRMTEAPSNGELALLLAQSDILHTGDATLKTEGFHLLLENKAQYGDSREFLWRLARAYCDVYKCTENKQEKKMYALQGLEEAELALKKNNLNAECHKWFALLAGLTSQNESMHSKLKSSSILKGHVERSLTLRDDDPMCFYLLGRWCYEVANLDWLEKKTAAAVYQQPPTSSLSDALENFLKAEELNPGVSKTVRLCIAKNESMHSKLKSSSILKGHVERSLTLRDDDPMCFYLLGRWCYEAEELNPGVSKTVRLCIAKCHKDLGNLSEARNWTELALKMTTNWNDVRTNFDSHFTNTIFFIKERITARQRLILPPPLTPNGGNMADKGCQQPVGPGSLPRRTLILWMPLPSTFAELQIFCSTNEATFQQLRRELGLDELLRHCEIVVEKLHYPEKDPCYLAMAGTALFTHTTFDMLQNHSRITAAVEKVELLWQQAFAKARLQLQVFQLRADALQITEQIKSLHQEKLQPYKIEIAKDDAKALKLVSEFEATIHTPAVASCWYSLVLHENILQELLSGVNGDTGSLRRQRKDWAAIPAWRQRISSFLTKHPPPDKGELVHLAHLSSVIPDEEVHQAGKRMSQSTPVSISSFDSGFDGVGNGQLEFCGGREDLCRFTEITDSEKPTLILPQVNKDGSACSDVAIHDEEFDCGSVGNSSGASIQIVPKAAADSLNFEIRVRRSAALPSNPWLSLPVDNLENSYTITITPNPTPQKTNQQLQDASEPSAAVGQLFRCGNRPTQTEKEENVLAQEAVLDALLRSESQREQWMWDKDNQTGGVCRYDSLFVQK
ncbi:unnamed protein product, partial [Tetraodon nigroviridis]